MHGHRVQLQRNRKMRSRDASGLRDLTLREILGRLAEFLQEEKWNVLQLSDQRRNWIDQGR